MGEQLLELGISAVALALASIGALLLRRYPLILAAVGVVLLGGAAWLAHAFLSSMGSFRTEGSPAGTIAFVMFLGGAFTAAVFGVTTLVTGLVAWRRGGEAPPIPRALWMFALVGTVVLMVIGHFRGIGEAKEAQADKAAAASSAERVRYEECVKLTLDWQQTETLKACADELAAAWDTHHLGKRRFAGMPEMREFARRLGAMYSAYGKGARDPQGGIEGLRSLRDRVEERLPREKELQSFLLALEQDLRQDARLR
jgi:hypothetical protein